MKPLLKKMIMKWFGLVEADETMKQLLAQDLHTGEQLLDSLGTAVIMFDQTGVMTYQNTAMKQLINIPTGEVVLLASLRSRFSRSEDYDRLEALFRKMNEAVGQTDGHLKAVHIIDRLGHVRILNIGVKCILVQGQPVTYITAMDVTSEHTYQWLKDLVIKLNNMLICSEPLQNLLDQLIETLVEKLDYVDVGTIMLKDDKGILSIKSTVGYAPEIKELFKLPYEKSFYYRFKDPDEHSPVIINDIDEIEDQFAIKIPVNLSGNRIESVLSSPIIIDGDFIGLLNLDATRKNAFSEFDLEMIRFISEQVTLILSALRYLEKTIHLSYHDQLTGLYNRWYLDEYSKTGFEVCLRSNQPFLLFSADLDGLKKVNDQYGHALGDQYILVMSQLLKKAFRETDILMRVGGDEFIGIIYHSEADEVSKRLMGLSDHLAHRMEVLGVEDVGCGLSFGIAEFPLESREFATLMILADRRMYEKKSKNTSQNRE